VSQPASAAARKILRVAWPLLTLIWTIVVLILALTPDADKLWVYQTFSDKILHAAAFAAGGLLWIKAVEALSRWKLVWAILLGSVAVLGLGIAIEILQRNIPGRSSDFFDFLSDALGLGIGLLILWGFEALQNRLCPDKT
jgi:VanZ family protein